MGRKKKRGYSIRIHPQERLLIDQELIRMRNEELARTGHLVTLSLADALRSLLEDLQVARECAKRCTCGAVSTLLGRRAPPDPELGSGADGNGLGDVDRVGEGLGEEALGEEAPEDEDLDDGASG